MRRMSHEGSARIGRLLLAAMIAIALRPGISASEESAKPKPPPAPASASKPPAPGASIEGNYSAGSAAISVKFISSDVLYIKSSAEWESVGFFGGPTYHGVFRERSGAIGEMTIDWIDPDNPSMQANYTIGRSGKLAERWRRVREDKIVVAPPSSGHRPEFGEYVYVEELPEAITKVQPSYPSGVSVEGTVLVQALVLEDGTVGDTRIVNSIPLLDDAAVASIRQWRFKPALTKGQPVAVWVAVPVRFTRH